VKDIEDRSPGGSLMPEGLVDNLTRAELVDLVRFLTELGKVGPYAVSRARLVRRWQVIDATPEALHRLAATRQAERSAEPVAAKLRFDDSNLTWSSAYSQVNGVLPLGVFPHVQMQKDSPAMGFARCQLDVLASGQVKVLLNSTSGLSLWLDGEPVEIHDSCILDLKPGLRTLTFAVDLSQRKDGLRCEFEDVPSSAARIRIVSGK
jgi:hypothetical protein